MKYRSVILAATLIAMFAGIPAHGETQPMDYFNEGSAKFITGKKDEALAKVNEGLSVFPGDYYLLALKKAIEENKQKNQQQQKDKDKQKQDQDKKDQQKKQDQDKQNQQDKKDQKQDQKQDQQDQQKKDAEQQQQAAKSGEMTKEEAVHAFDVLMAFYKLKAINVGDSSFKIVSLSSGGN